MNKTTQILLAALFSSIHCLAQFSLQQELGYELEKIKGFKTADLNGDGLSDVVAFTNENNRKIVGQFKLTEPGLFSLPILIADELPYIKALELTDVDADGDIDIMCLLADPSEIVWFENQAGTGQFSRRPGYSLGFDMKENYLIEDFNRNGAPDLVFHAFVNGGTSFYVANDGQGHFAEPVPIAENDQAQRNQVFAAYPWNEDAYPDLFIATSEDENDVEVFLFDPATQSFTSSEVLLPAIAEPRFISVDDLDEDGFPELFLFHRHDRFSFQLSRFYKEKEAAAWQQDTLLEPGFFSVNYLRTLDLDENGEKDIVIGTHDFSFQNGLFVFKQQNGVFPALDTLLQKPEKSEFYALEDFNGDGKTDVLQGSEAGCYYALFSPQADEWEAIQPIPINMFRWNMALGDMDLDGDADLLVTSPRQGFIAIVSNNQPFDRVKVIETGLSQAERALPMDIDQDGDQDFLYVKSSGFSDGGFWLYKNDGTGNYTAKLVDRELVGADYVRAVDLDGDEDLDLVTANALWRGIFYYFNEDGQGNFGERQFLSLPEPPTDVDMVDWDKDGDEDLVMTLSGDERLQLSRWEAGQFQALELLKFVRGFWAWRDMALLDVNDDDYPDAVSFDGTGNILYHLNTEKDSSDFNEWAFLFLRTEAEVNRVMALDINHDGRKDILATTELKGRQDSLLWIPAPFDSTIQSRAVYQHPPAGFIFQAGPIDRDARPDLIMYHEEREVFSWWRNETGAPSIVTRVFYDQNGNGEKEANERWLRDIPVLMEPREQTRFSNKDGAAVFFLSDGTYTAEVQYPDIWQTTTADSYTFPAEAGERPDTLLFGLEAIEPIAAAEISGLPSRARCNESGHIDLQLKNAGTLPLSGELRLLTTPPLSISFAENGELLSDEKEAVWLLDDVPVSQSVSVRAYLNPVSTAFIGDTLQALAIAEVMGPEGEVAADTFQIFTPLFCSYDPNDKLVQTARAKADRIDPGEALFYTIRFQNTGNDTAFQVVLRDPLAPELDWGSFQALQASHEFDLQIDQNGLLEVRFSNIMLVDSLTDEEASQGFFHFSIKTREELNIGDMIQNQAGIYFDGNPPIFTNTVISQIKGTVHINGVEPLKESTLKVFPNPVQDQVQLEWTFPDASEIFLLDVYGRVLQSIQPAEGQNRLQWSIGNRPQGLYLIHLKGKGSKVLASSWIVLQ